MKIQLLLIASAIILLSSCGFTLRGEVPLPAALDRFSVVGSDIALAKRLEETLIAHGKSATTTDDTTATKIHLAYSEYSRTVRTTDADGYATSYTLHYHVQYDVHAATGDMLQANQELMLKQVLDYNPLQHLQSEEEEAFLKMEMQKEMVQLILHRLSWLQQN